MRRTPGVLAALPFALLGLPLLAQKAPTVQVPVVLDVHGLNGSHYTSDLTVANTGLVSSEVELTFYGTLGPSAGPYLLVQSVPPGRVIYIPDVIALLADLGAPMPRDGSSVVGTLLVRLPQGDLNPPFVGSRVSTPNPNAAIGGSFGTYAVGTPVGPGGSAIAYVMGLRENATARTNLAFVHAGGGARERLTLQVVVYDGETGRPGPSPISVTLDPGQWFQISSVLAGFGFSQGWAKVLQETGTDHYIVYAVANDGGAGGGGTSDGSWIDPNLSEWTVPVVLRSGAYKTELVLARPPSMAGSSDVVALSYTSSDYFNAAGISGTPHLSIPLGTQIVVPDAIEFLHSLGLGIPEEGAQGGVLRVTGAVALARIYSPNPDTTVGGSFGVAFRAVSPGQRATTDAWIYGLRQDATARSNVAIANAAVNGTAPARFSVDFFDQSGRALGTLAKQMAGAQFFQWNAPLATFRATAGYAHVHCVPPPTAAACDFIAYGVVNDGAAPGVGTSDGSYIPMVRVQ